MSSATTEATTQPAAPSVSPAEAARALRHQRARKLVIGLVTWVLAPTLLAAVYFGFVASDQYESVASFALRGPDAAADAAMLRDFIASRAALKQLDGGGKLRAHFQHGGDALSRLSSGAGDEALFNYYRGKVETSFDSQASVLTLRLRAFSGKAAQQYNERLVQACDELLRGMGSQEGPSRIEAAEQVLASAKAELLRVQRALTQQELATGTTALETRGAAREQSLEQRTALEATRFEKSLAERAYESASQALDHARSERTRHTQIVSVAAPSLPDQATHPRRGYGILTVFFAALALFGIGKLLVAAVREHAQF